jgi:hypothetical protein
MAPPDEMENIVSSNRKCFWLDETHEVEGGFQLNIVTENEDGYSAVPVVVRVTNVVDAKAYVSVLNDSLFGLSPADTSWIVMSSMFPESRTEPDTRQAWTVIGYTENYGAEYAIGSVKGHHNAYGDDDPAGMGTWAEWVWTEDDSDGNAPGRIALAQRAAERGE